MMSDRRRWLQLAAASASTLWLPRSAWSQPHLPGNPFTLGVASGWPTPEGVVLWTRLALSDFWGSNLLPQAPITVRWEVAHDSAFSRIVQSGQAQALPELAHAVHVQVQGLQPQRWYHYRFMVDTAVSPAGRTRTLPAPDEQAKRLRLAYASCQRWEHGYYAAYRHMLAEELDAVLFLGDYIYEYPNAQAAVRRPNRTAHDGWTVTLEDYRSRYALHKSDTDLQAIHAAVPWWVTWDDHEVQNDYAGLQAGDSGPTAPQHPGGFAAQRAAAYQAFYEHMPLPVSVLTQGRAGLTTGADMRIYGQVRWGQLAQLYLLDARQYRNAQACGPAGKLGSSFFNPAQCDQWADPARSLLGAAQERWLAQALGASAGRWNILGQSTLFGPRNFHLGAGQSLWNDGWDGYPAARQRLVNALRAPAASNPVLLGGDVHENWVGHVLADYSQPGSASVGVEFCGTSITSRSSGTDKLPERLAKNPHFIFADGRQRGYGVAQFTPDRLVTTLRVVDDVQRRDAGVATLASFEVAAGRSRVEQV